MGSLYSVGYGVHGVECIVPARYSVPLIHALQINWKSSLNNHKLENCSQCTSMHSNMHLYDCFRLYSDYLRQLKTCFEKYICQIDSNAHLCMYHIKLHRLSRFTWISIWVS